MMNAQQRLELIRGLAPSPGAENLSINDVKSGGYIEFRNETWYVRKLFKYLDVKWKDFSTRKKDYWVTELELVSLSTGQVLYVEWEIDDDIEISVTDETARLREISYLGSPIKFDDLLEIAEEEEGTVTFRGEAFHYSEDDTWAALFYPDARKGVDGESYPVRMFEFESNSGRALTIEAWHADPDEKPEREAFTSLLARASDFAVLNPGA